MTVREPRRRLIGLVRNRLIRATTSPFAHAPYPLSRTLEHRGDPGLLGPDSVSWKLIGDIAAIVGGIRGLLVQAAHPEVVAGVGDHSRYREDPLGRLSRTSAYVTATTYGSMPEVDEAVALVQRAHRRVTGVSSRGLLYRAQDPDLSAWVHNALTDSFLTAHLVFGGMAISEAEADMFVSEQTRVGALLGADPMPTTREELSIWIAEHPSIDQSPDMTDAVAFLTNPPLDPAVRVGYEVLLQAAIATLPDRIATILGLTPKPGARAVGRAAVAGLRWALGYSPSWRIALERVDRPIPVGLFTQEPRVA